MPRDDGLLRRASASLRAHVRPDDLICHGGAGLLVLVLPGLPRHPARGRAEQLHEAAARACGAGARVAVEAAVWEVGQEPLAVLARCVAALQVA